MTKSNDNIHYARVAKAIAFIQAEFKSQPSLDEIASHVGISAFHFQRLFTEWAGVSPKQFLQFISAEYAKGLLRDSRSTLLEVTHETGLSSTSRLHDLFVTIEGMTPGEYKNGGLHLTICYSAQESPFGQLLVASTPKGICYMAFEEEVEKGVQNMKPLYPKATWIATEDILHRRAMQFFTRNSDWNAKIPLHIKGSEFQLKVWEALLKIPYGQLTTYGNIANEIDQPGASRAVGTAIGNNPIAFIIPCHRVIQASGVIGGYMWSPLRKKAIIGWEASGIHHSGSEF